MLFLVCVFIDGLLGLLLSALLLGIVLTFRVVVLLLLLVALAILIHHLLLVVDDVLLDIIRLLL